ncbi:hypothetical protein MLP_49760 [Microlunatus phosphovorus NM-1]|uniref:Uncharacterized protein n=1 Tax=Microlunatus phosphovorus (strain ATCC 700054 / DSM 10555 / JCM 9379 / NBRC 101784 / NCIMB 13414 / VKM Ac-1990 / NM-1) TaxID=1032480 RepID=F5XG56_MICPN|nr:hypothetical protein MLP_49760 [Microlunatus phosphovorus NM-1]
MVGAAGPETIAARADSGTSCARGPQLAADQTEDPYVLRPRAKDDRR